MWLIVLMISATFTGRIIKTYEEVLQSVVVLASFIPMLMDTGGNAGAQSSTTVIRALSLGDVETKDIFKILRKEFFTSTIVAIVLAAINYLRLITLTKISLDVALVVSVTLILVVIISKVIGAFLPHLQAFLLLYLLYHQNKVRQIYFLSQYLLMRKLSFPDVQNPDMKIQQPLYLF